MERSWTNAYCKLLVVGRDGLVSMVVVEVQEENLRHENCAGRGLKRLNELHLSILHASALTKATPPTPGRISDLAESSLARHLTTLLFAPNFYDKNIE